MKIWTCPMCNDEVRGPNRITRGDIRRYCLSCSESYQTMIFRISHNDTKRPLNKSKIRRSKPEKYYVEGVNLRHKLRDFCFKPTVWKDYFHLKGLPEFTIRYSKTRSYITGCSWREEHRFCITMGLASDLADAEAVMLHELAHLADDNVRHHSNTWKELYCSAVNQLYRMKIDYEGLTMHELDDVIMEEIRTYKLFD